MMCCQNNSNFSNLIDILMVIGTFLAVIVSLFGDVFRRKWFGPKLVLKEEDRFGEYTVVKKTGYRFFHLVVSNKRKALANNTMVMLTKVETREKSGRRELWVGEVPLRWMYADNYYKSFTRNIGSTQICDLLCVSEKGLNLQLRFTPQNLKVDGSKKCNLYLTVLAKSDEAVSDPICVHVDWDGVWSPEEEELKKHLKITLV